MMRNKYLTIHVNGVRGRWNYRVMSGDELIAGGTKRTQADARTAAGKARYEHVAKNGTAWRQFDKLTHSGNGWRARNQARKVVAA